MKCFLPLLLLFLLPGCKNQTANPTPELNINQQLSMKPDQSDQPFFKAKGSGWTLSISDRRIAFNSNKNGFTSFNAPHTEPILVMDANIKNYRSEPEAGVIEVQIAQGECKNSTSSYAVTVRVKRGIDEDYTEFKGCGNYLLDYRLHDIWVLNRIYNEPVSENQFREQLPSLEINAGEKSFFGFGGCNQIRGQLFTEHKLLRFINIAQTRMLCAPPNKEDAFIKALKSSTHYQINNNELILSNPDRETLRFKKTD